MVDEIDLTEYATGSLFANPPNGEFHDLVACTGENGGPYNFGAYAMGYMEANRRLKGTLVDDPTMIDILIYPIVFNYRQAVELGLKHLVFYLRAIYGTGDTPEMNHGLTNNWLILRPLIEKHRDAFNFKYPSLRREQLDGVERLIKDLHSFAPNSFVFRYPENKQGVAYITGFYRIDVANVVDNMSLLENWFERLIEGIPEDLSDAQ